MNTKHPDESSTLVRKIGEKIILDTVSYFWKLLLVAAIALLFPYLQEWYQQAVEYFSDMKLIGQLIIDCGRMLLRLVILLFIAFGG